MNNELHEEGKIIRGDGAPSVFRSSSSSLLIRVIRSSFVCIPATAADVPFVFPGAGRAADLRVDDAGLVHRWRGAGI